MAIAMAQEGGIGVIHKNLSIEEQSDKVRKVKRSESGMILDPITLSKSKTVADALNCMKEYSIGGIPVVDSNKKLIGIDANNVKFLNIFIWGLMDNGNKILNNLSDLERHLDEK